MNIEKAIDSVVEAEKATSPEEVRAMVEKMGHLISRYWAEKMEEADSKVEADFFDEFSELMDLARHVLYYYFAYRRAMQAGGGKEMQVQASYIRQAYQKLTHASE